MLPRTLGPGRMRVRDAAMRSCVLALALWSSRETARADAPRIDYYSLDSVISQKAVFPHEPGPPPALEASDYEPYRQRGSGTIVGAPFVSTSDGRTFRCGPGLGVALFPKTPYTAWMLDEYFWTVSKTGYWVDPSKNVNGPSYLSYFSKDSIVRLGSCRDNGYFVVANLPPGRYLALTQINVPNSAPYHDFSKDQTVTTPDGQSAMAYDNTVSTSLFYSDGWSLIGGTFVVSPSGGEVDVPDKAWTTVVHIHAGNPGVRASPARERS